VTSCTASSRRRLGGSFRSDPDDLLHAADERPLTGHEADASLCSACRTSRASASCGLGAHIERPRRGLGGRALFCDEAHIGACSVGSNRIVGRMKGALQLRGGQVLSRVHPTTGAIVPVLGTLNGERCIALLKGQKHMPGILEHNIPPPPWPGTARIYFHDNAPRRNYGRKAKEYIRNEMGLGTMRMPARTAKLNVIDFFRPCARVRRPEQDNTRQLEALIREATAEMRQGPSGQRRSRRSAKACRSALPP
jgi:hypothetical protein